MDGRYPPGLWVVLIDCIDPAREGEFNKWYDELVTPQREATGYIQNSRRYENVFNEEPTFRGRPKYLTLSEIYRDDLEEVLREIRQFDAELVARGERFDGFVAKMATVYRRIGPEFRSERSDRPVQSVYCALVGCAVPDREDEFNKWYNEKHTPEALEAGLFDTGYRYSVVNPNDPVPHQSAPYLSLYETSLDLLTLQDRMEKFRQKMILEDPLWVNLLTIYYSGLFRQIYP